MEFKSLLSGHLFTHNIYFGFPWLSGHHKYFSSVRSTPRFVLPLLLLPQVLPKESTPNNKRFVSPFSRAYLATNAINSQNRSKKIRQHESVWRRRIISGFSLYLGISLNGLPESLERQTSSPKASSGDCLTHPKFLVNFQLFCNITHVFISKRLFQISPMPEATTPLAYFINPAISRCPPFKNVKPPVCSLGKSSPIWFRPIICISGLAKEALKRLIVQVYNANGMCRLPIEQLHVHEMVNYQTQRVLAVEYSYLTEDPQKPTYPSSPCFAKLLPTLLEVRAIILKISTVFLRHISINACSRSTCRAV